MPHNGYKQNDPTPLNKVLRRLIESTDKLREDLVPIVGDLIDDAKEKAKTVDHPRGRLLFRVLLEIRISTFILVYILKHGGIHISSKEATHNRPKLIKSPPGGRLLRIADFFCSPKTMNLAVLPTVADWRNEYYASLNQRRVWKARWISIRYYFRFIKVLGLDKVLSLIKSFSSAR